MIDERGRRAQFTGGEIAPDGRRSDHTGIIRIEAAQLAMVGLAPGTDGGQRKEHQQADRKNWQGMGDDKISDTRPESVRRSVS